MKLTAMMIVHNELERYLPLTIASLVNFCDEVRVLDDGSSDDTWNWLTKYKFENVVAERTERTLFYEHEGRARQRLLEFAMAGQPTHLLAIDADEFVADGERVRAACEVDNTHGVWSLQMEEVWQAREESLSVRLDGGWRPHTIGCLFRVPEMGEDRRARREWRLPDRALACGRVPIHAMLAGNRSNGGEPTGTEILHFGWTNENDRERRYQRYVTHDGGAFHNNKHLDSIMWDDSQVTLQPRAWPPTLDKQAILERTRR